MKVDDFLPQLLDLLFEFVIFNAEGMGFGGILDQVLDLRVKEVLFELVIHVIDRSVFLVAVEIKVEGVDALLCGCL